MAIYCDNSATTAVNKDVLEEMMPYFITNFGNASSMHYYGEIAKEAIDNARLRIANQLGCKPSEIIFTSGATESNNMVLNNFIGKHIITTPYEHHAILHTINSLCINTTYVPVYSNGVASIKDIELAMKSDTKLVSVMAVNNEIGTINPIEEIAEMCAKYNVFFHTDATQYIGHLDKKINLENINYMSFSGHKFGAPKGIGVLYVKKGSPIRPLLFGGQQENGLRAGTENVPYIVGIAKALEIANSVSKKHIIELREKLITELLKIPGIKLNGDRELRCPGIINISIEGIKGEVLQSILDQYGIACSTGSACNSESNEPSHVLKAIGLSDEEANSSLRLSLGDDISSSDIDYIIKTISSVIELVRGN